MTVPAFASNFPAVPAVWSYSANAGGSYTSPAPASTAQVVGPTGTQRYRQIITVPVGVHGSYTVTVGGDIWDGVANVPAHLYYNGVDQGAIPTAGSRTFVLPAVPGAHTLEIWIGQANVGGGATAPTATFAFTNTFDSGTVNACGCCPTGLEGCLIPVSPLACAAATIASASTTWDQQHATPDTAAMVANPGNASFGNPNLTRDKNLSGNAAMVINSGTGGVYDTNVTFRWTYVTPVNDIWGFSIWHGWGNVLNDGDGVSAATLTVYAGATVLFTGPITTGSGGQEFQTVFPGRLNGITHFELSHIFGQGNVGVGIREVALNYPWRGTFAENCAPAQISAAIESQAATFAAGLTLSGGVMGQTNGPHTMTWTVPAGVSGTIVTNLPGDFSTLGPIVDGTIVTVSGNHNRTFSITWTAPEPEELAEPVYGLLCDGAVTWIDSSGNPVPDPSQVRAGRCA